MTLLISAGTVQPGKAAADKLATLAAQTRLAQAARKPAA